MARRIILAIIVIVIAIASLAQKTASKTTHVAGDGFGWQVLPFLPFAYVTWAATQTFTVGDVLVFDFTTGKEDVARVTKEAYLTCNSRNPISLKTIGPANFTLESVGEYYFICTIGLHCSFGQKLAISVTARAGASPPPSIPPSSNIGPLPPPPPSSNIAPLPSPPSINIAPLPSPPSSNILPSPPSSEIAPLPASSTPSPGPIAGSPPSPPPPRSSASAQVVGGFCITLLCTAAAMVLVY